MMKGEGFGPVGQLKYPISWSLKSPYRSDARNDFALSDEPYNIKPFRFGLLLKMPNVKSLKRKLTKEEKEEMEEFKQKNINYMKEQLQMSKNQAQSLDIARELLSLTNDPIYSDIVNDLNTDVTEKETVLVQTVKENIIEIEIESDDDLTEGCCDNLTNTEKCLEITLDKTVFKI